MVEIRASIRDPGIPEIILGTTEGSELQKPENCVDERGYHPKLFPSLTTST